MANESEKSVNTKEGSKLKKFLKNFIIPTALPCLRDVDLPDGIRSVMLVAAGLVAAVTFQAAASPPGGVWQDDNQGRVPGQAIYSSQRVPFFLFLACNTLAFTSSLYLLLALTFGYPFFLEVLVATLSICGTYAAAIFCVAPYETAPFCLVALAATVPVVLRPAICFVCSKYEEKKKVESYSSHFTVKFGVSCCSSACRNTHNCLYVVLDHEKHDTTNKVESAEMKSTV